VKIDHKGRDVDVMEERRFNQKKRDDIKKEFTPSRLYRELVESPMTRDIDKSAIGKEMIRKDTNIRTKTTAHNIMKKPYKMSRSNAININSSKRGFQMDKTKTLESGQMTEEKPTDVLGRGQRDRRPQPWMKDYVNYLPKPSDMPFLTDTVIAKIESQISILHNPT
jgi:hypothetical protein